MTSKKRAAIKSDAQRMKTKYQIGAAQLHDNSYIMIDTGFNNCEVVKIKVNREDKTDKNIVRELAGKITEKVDCELVDIIGTTIILYRQHKDEDKRKKYD